MNDQKIKDLLKKDNTTPQSPTNEWGYIERKLQETPNASFGWLPSFKIGIVACTLVLSIVVVRQFLTPQMDPVSDKELVEYLFQDNYLDANEETLYAWVD